MAQPSHLPHILIIFCADSSHSCSVPLMLCPDDSNTCAAHASSRVNTREEVRKHARVCPTAGQEQNCEGRAGWPSVAMQLLMFLCNPQSLESTWPTCTLTLWCFLS